MSLQHLVVGCIASSVTAKRFTELVGRLALREKDTVPDLEFTDALGRSLVHAIQQLPAARPIVITYLQECMASNLISATQLVDYVLEYGKAVHEGLKKPELFTSGEDVDRFCEILYEGLPSVVLAQKSSITEGTSMVELLLSLTGMLGDVNEQHPGTCQFFTNSLSVVSERQAWSEIELEALSVFKSSADRLATIPQTILQDIHLVGTLPNVSDSLRLAEGPWASRVPLGADDDEPSLPSSPDPWTISPVAANGQVGDGEILQIRAPPYITLMVKTALETSWGHGFESQTHQGQTIDIPNSYRRIIHTAPEVCSRPSTFLYHLLCASFGLLALSINDLQERAVKEQNHATNIADNADEVMMSLNSGQNGKVSDNLKFGRMKEIIARDGWKTWTWCFAGMIQVLQYWKTLSQKHEGYVFQHKWHLPSSEEFLEVMGGFSTVYGREIQRCNEVLSAVSCSNSGETKDTSKTIDILTLFKTEAVRAGIIATANSETVSGLSQAGVEISNGNGAIDFDAQTFADLDPSQFPHKFFDMLLSPNNWQKVIEGLIQFLRNPSTTSDGLLIVLTTYNGLLDFMCENCRPREMLDIVHDAMVTLDEPSKTDSDDPQAHLTTFGAWYLLACILCERYRLRKPEILRTCTEILNIKDLSEDDDQITRSWIEALFGSSGISDELLQMTSPIRLLRLSTTVVAQAILAASAQVIDLETLRGGLSYFSQPLLSWCQVGIIRWLCCETQRQGMYAHIYLDVLQALVGAGDFPAAILRVTANNILQLFDEGNGLELVLESSSIDALGIQRKARFSLDSGMGDESSFTSQTISHTCSSLLRLALQSPQVHGIASAARLYDLVYQVRRTHSFKAVNFRSALKGDVTGRRLLIVILGIIGSAGQQVDVDLAEACTRIEQYNSIA